MNDTTPAIRPFVAAVPDEAIDDLKARLARTRWPDLETVSDWSQGVRSDNLRRLLQRWEHDYDWRDFESRLNAHPQFLTEIDGVDIHFVHIRSPHTDALPLILTHGWPSSVIDFLRLIGPLTDGQIELDEPSTHIIGPNVTLTQKFTFSGRRVTVNVGWPGSDVVTTLISPSGVRYTRDDARDAAHTNGPTWETFTIEDPEPGEWTIEMFGADVDPEGEPVDLVVTDTPDWNAEPVADINVTRIDDDTYRFDATGSTDADGEITGYEWDFGDSVTMVPGAVVEHTFAPGDFKVALVVTDDDGGLDLTTTEGTITVAEPNRASDIVIRSGTQFTNQLQITGDTFIDGNLQCNSAATIDGRLTVAGTLHLTNDCAIEGDVIATGDVTLDSRSSITGDLTSAGSIQMQSSSTVAGTIAVTGALTIIDGVSVDALIASGHIGAVELQHPVLTVTGPVQEATEVATTTMWRQWLNTLARQSGAPPWSPGLSASPGCTIAPWTINAADVVVTESLAIDARRTATGCSAIQIQGTSLTLSSDLTLYVDSFAASNGLRVRSADGDAHRLRIIVTDGDPSCANNTIRLIGDTDIDPLSTST